MLNIKETPVELNTEQLQKIAEMITHYPEGKQKSALLPLLHYLQDLNNNWLSTPVMNQVADILGITPIEVYEVATFYSMYNLKPVGKYLLEVCRTGPCMIEGAEKIVKYLEQKLHIKEGETSSDGMFTLKCVECLGACGYAPMMQVGEYYYEHLNEERIDTLLHDFRMKALSDN